MSSPPDLDPADLTTAVDALRRGDGARAAALLEPFFHALADVPDLADVHTRVCSLLAQARLLSGDPEGAQIPLRQALRAVPRDDEQALRTLRTLQGTVFAALARRRADAEAAAARARLADTPLDALLDGTDTPEARAARLIEKGIADREAGRDATALFEQAREEADRAGCPRPRVLARLGLAACPGADTPRLVREAWDIADAADEPTLAGIVAADAHARGVPLPVLDGPLGVREPQCG